MLTANIDISDRLINGQIDTVVNIYVNPNFYDNCRNSRALMVNFYRQYADRHMNLKFMWRVSARERAIRPFVIVNVSF